MSERIYGELADGYDRMSATHPANASYDRAAQMWRRSVSAVFRPLLAAGFVIDAVEEPGPVGGEDDTADPRIRRVLNTQPVFLYVRAVTPG